MMPGGHLPNPLPAMTPGYAQTSINTPINLYNGPVEVHQGAVVAAGQAQIDLRWFPIPEVAFQFDVPPAAAFNLGRCQVIFLLRATTVDAMIINVETNLAAGAASKRIKVFLDQGAAFDTGSPARKATFEVVNFFNYHGQMIGRIVGANAQANVRGGRVMLTGGGWRVTVDSIDEVSAVVSALRAEGGYGLTHTGFAERDDGSDFSWAQFQELENALFDFLSFARGSWSAAILPKAVNTAGGASFSGWEVPKLSIWKTNDAWFSPLHAGELPVLFPGFMTRWQDPRWREAVPFAVHAYVESNSQSGSMESSILLGQITLELLSAAILVEEHGVATAADFNKSNLWPAMKKFQQLLTFCKIPTAIPPSLVHLTAAAGPQGWADGPQALTQTRNKIAHSSLPNLRKLSAITSELKSELRTLTLWYVELVLLWWFNYKGGYRSRVDPPPHHLENHVPWAPPAVPAPVVP